MVAVTHHVSAPGFDVGVRTHTGVEPKATPKVWKLLVVAEIEIVPAKSSEAALVFRCDPVDLSAIWFTAFKLKLEST